MFVVPDVNLLYYIFMSLPILKMITDVVYLISSTRENCWFVATDDVVLEEYNSCLANKKWLNVKHVSIVLG